MGCSIALADDVWSDLDNLWWRADFCLFSSGGAFDPGGSLEFGSREHRITVSAQLLFFLAMEPCNW